MYKTVQTVASRMLIINDVVFLSFFIFSESLMSADILLATGGTTDEPNVGRKLKKVSERQNHRETKK
jgi:hypothetical protein